MVFRPLAGCGLFRPRSATGSMPSRFPSPCGVWVVSHGCIDTATGISFRPLAGCGLFPSGRCLRHGLSGVSVPLRGVGCFTWVHRYCYRDKFPSPCGVWVVSITPIIPSYNPQFPSPCGVWVVSILLSATLSSSSFRPLAGCGLFRRIADYDDGKRGGSVPLRGVGCFDSIAEMSNATCGFRPLAGCGLFPITTGASAALTGFRPLAGCGLFPCRLMY